MKFSITQPAFLRLLKAQVLNPRNALPILNNTLLDIGLMGDRLHGCSSDLTVGFSASVPAQGLDAGSVCIPTKLARELVGNLPDARIDCSLAERTQILTLTTSGGKNKHTSQIKCLPASDFVTFPEHGTHELTLPVETLKLCLGMVSFAMANEDSRPALHGVAFHFGKNQQLLVEAADGYRLSVLRGLRYEGEAAKKFIVPAQVIPLLLQELPAAASLSVYLDPDPGLPEAGGEAVRGGIRRVTFAFTSAEGLVSEVNSITVNAPYPDIAKLVPDPKSMASVTFSVAELKHLLTAAKPFGDKKENPGIDLRSTGEGRLEGRLLDESGRGDFFGFVPVPEGQGAFTTKLQLHFLTQLLSVSASEKLTLFSSSPEKPVLLQSDEEYGYSHVIMPMHA